MLRLIMLKPALCAVFPSLASQVVLLTLTTSIRSSIAAFELTSAARRIDGGTFQSLEVYFTISVVYLALAWAVMTPLAGVARLAFSCPAAR